MTAGTFLVGGLHELLAHHMRMTAAAAAAAPPPPAAASSSAEPAMHGAPSSRRGAREAPGSAGVKPGSAGVKPGSAGGAGPGASVLAGESSAAPIGYRPRWPGGGGEAVAAGGGGGGGGGGGSRGVGSGADLWAAPLGHPKAKVRGDTPPHATTHAENAEGRAAERGTERVADPRAAFSAATVERGPLERPPEPALGPRFVSRPREGGREGARDTPSLPPGGLAGAAHPAAQPPVSVTGPSFSGQVPRPPVGGGRPRKGNGDDAAARHAILMSHLGGGAGRR